MATSLTAILNYLQEDIFLRLPDPADLARASAACVSFRRLVTDRSFIRRFHRLHAPPLLAFLDRDGFHPALPPHPSTPAARACPCRRLLLSFLPSHCSWIVRDIRDGRVLLSPKPERGEEHTIFTKLVVCEPLHWRYILLPPVPDDLAVSVEHLGSIVGSCRKPFLAPLHEEEAGTAAEETAFRVIWMAYGKTKLAALVFSSSTGQWQAAASMDWIDLVK